MAKYFHKEGEEIDAIQYYKKALKINPNNTEANIFLAQDYYKQKNYDQALTYFKKIADLCPLSSKVFLNIGYILYQQGNIQEAIEYLKKAITLNPKDTEVYKWLSFAYLMLGHIDKGYEIEDYAYNIKVENGIINRQWDGYADLKGRTLLIHDDIGIGDIFCFIRYAKIFKERGAKIVFNTRKFLFPLLSKCPYIDHLHERFKGVPMHDYVVYVSRLPRVVYRLIGRATGEIPYLFADQKRVDFWGKKLSHDNNFKVGICWDASRHVNVKTGKQTKTNRSMPLYYFYYLSEIKGVTLYSLQQRNGTDQLTHMPKDFKIHIFEGDFDKKYGSFTDTAAVMKNLDLIITVDTSIAHLAGGLSVPVWVILPYVPDWRWLIAKSDTYLYPTMKFFRQKSLDDWGSAMEQVIQVLAIKRKKILQK